MSILIDKNTRVVTQGITGKTGMFHTQTSRAYAGGKQAFVAGVNPKKAGENFEGIPIFGSVSEAKQKTGVSNVERLVQESALGKEAFNRVKKLNDAKKDEGDKLQKELREWLSGK